NVPTALASAADAAKSVIAVSGRHRQKRAAAKPVFALWVGGSQSLSKAFDTAGIPSYATETGAIAGFMHFVRYRETRELLMATPPIPPSARSLSSGKEARRSRSSATRRWRCHRSTSHLPAD